MEMDTKKITQEPYDKADLDETVETLRRGGIILYPTDTVWGIGCDATNEEAVRRIYELKRREDSKSMLVLVGETYEVERLVSEVPEVAYDLMELAVRPITIIYPPKLMVRALAMMELQVLCGLIRLLRWEMELSTFVTPWLISSRTM